MNTISSLKGLKSSFFSSKNNYHPFSKTIGKRNVLTSVQYPALPIIEPEFANQQKVTRFTVVPETLYRLQLSLPVSVRVYHVYRARGLMLKFRQGYDVQLRGGLVHPYDGDNYYGPNGIEINTAFDILQLIYIVQQNPRIFKLEEGMIIPDHLILLNERKNIFSLQPRVPMTAEGFGDTLTDFLTPLPSYSSSEFISLMEKELPQEDLDRIIKDPNHKIRRSRPRVRINPESLANPVPYYLRDLPIIDKKKQEKEKEKEKEKENKEAEGGEEENK